MSSVRATPRVVEARIEKMRIAALADLAGVLLAGLRARVGCFLRPPLIPDARLNVDDVLLY